MDQKVKVGGREYVLVGLDEVIKEGALHTLDGSVFNPLMNPDTVGQTPAEFTRSFYNPVETDVEKKRKAKLEKVSETGEK